MQPVAEFFRLRPLNYGHTANAYLQQGKPPAFWEAFMACRFTIRARVKPVAPRAPEAAWLSCR